MSPLQREIITGQDVRYSPFKSDVFALGMTALSLATLTVLDVPWPLQGLEGRVRLAVRKLGYSQVCQDLLLAMLAVEEDLRPSMQTVQNLMGQSIASSCIEETKRPAATLSGLVSVWENRIKTVDFARKVWVSSPLSTTINIGEHSRYVWVDTGLFCSGGIQSLGQPSERFKQDAYLLKPGSRDWAVTHLTDMNVARYSHGLWWFQTNRKVMVFGGTC